MTVIVVDVTGLAEQRQRKMTRRARATAIMLGVLLVAVLAGCVYGFNYLATNSAYLVDQNGKVAIYQGVPGELFGFSAHKLVRATEVSTDDLQPGTANRLREEGIKVDNLDAAESLVKEYETEIAERRTADEAAAAQAAAAGQQSGSADAPPSSGGAVPGGAQPDGGAPTSGAAAPADESAQPAATPAADPAQPAR